MIVTIPLLSRCVLLLIFFCHFIESSLCQGKGRAFCAGGDAAVGSQAVLDGNYITALISLSQRCPILLKADFVAEFVLSSVASYGSNLFQCVCSLSCAFNS